MIPIEYFWGVLILVFAIIGAARGMHKELGATAILLLSLFALYIGWQQLGESLYMLIKGRAAGATATTVEAAYYSIVMLFVAYVSYAGVVLEFPIKAMSGLIKGFLGFFGGVLNGYLLVGTIWDVVAKANYFNLPNSVGYWTLTPLHQKLVEYLPMTLMDKSSPYIALGLGMILLLAIVLK
jgi:uncharacterized membrane protein required for colicin V production